jgi:glycosyltransferase involved in cell wall biosynthesis
MKVIHIVASLDKSTGGPSRSVPQTCEQVSQLGVQITLITQPSEHPVSVATSKTLEVKFLTIMQLIAFGRSISNKEFDLIHLQHIWNPYIHVMAWWARRKNIPYVVTPRGMLEPWILNQNPFKKKLGLFLYQKKDLKKAALIHATCELEKVNIRSLGFTNPITIIPNGVDLSEVKEIKTQYGTKKIVFLSRIHPKKGIELLIQAWRDIDTMDWTLEIAGNGEAAYVETLTQSAIDLKNVRFVGSQFGEAKWDFLRSADIMVLPTYSENFGIVVAEALAVGVPVITTKGTPWEELNTKGCGWWIELTDLELKKTLKKAMKTQVEEIKKMGEIGIDLINNKYAITSVGKSGLDMYNSILTKELKN